MDNDDLLSVFIYEEDNGLSTCFHETYFKDMLGGQLDAYVFPDSLTPPDKVLDFHEYDEEISHSVHIWDNRLNDMGLTLAPFFDIIKVVFLISKWNVVFNIHEVHIQVIPMTY